MFSKSLSALLFSSSIALCSVACGAAPDLSEGDEVSTEEAAKANVKTGSLTLFPKLGAIPSGCDVITTLELGSAFYSTATLTDSTAGTCSTSVSPNKRTYRLRLMSTSCGSRTYAGSVTKNGQSSKVNIVDNRDRRCEDVVAAKVVVEETRNKLTKELFSYEPAPVSSAPAVFPADATKVVAQASAGVSRPPSGSQCTFGSAAFSFDVVAQEVTWQVCDSPDLNKPYTLKSGITKLTSSSSAQLLAALKGLSVSTKQTCGPQDKVQLELGISSTSQEYRYYLDSNWACGLPGAPFVDNIDALFTAFRSVTGT